MQITKNKVATFEFTVTGESGEVLDSSKESGPFPYIHGIGYLVPGLESALEGKSSGDSFSVSVSPAQGYGERDESRLHVVPKDKFEGIDDLSVGMQLQAKDPNGIGVVTVTKIEEEGVTLDGNHPLAGRTLNFDVTVGEVRDATKEELDNGHLHGDGCHEDGCQHDCCE